MMQAINLASAQFMDEQGLLWPITDYFDEQGEQCEVDDAKSVLAGAGSNWFALDLSQFSEKPF